MDLSDFVNTILTIQNGLIMVSTSALIQALRRVFPGQCDKGWFVRVQPILPLILCSAFVWLPGARPPEEAGTRFLIGIILGTVSASAYKTFVQSVMGKDKRLNGDLK